MPVQPYLYFDFMQPICFLVAHTIDDDPLNDRVTVIGTEKECNEFWNFTKEPNDLPIVANGYICHIVKSKTSVGLYELEETHHYTRPVNEGPMTFNECVALAVSRNYVYALINLEGEVELTSLRMELKIARDTPTYAIDDLKKCRVAIPTYASMEPRSKTTTTFETATTVNEIKKPTMDNLLRYEIIAGTGELIGTPKGPWVKHSDVKQLFDWYKEPTETLFTLPKAYEECFTHNATHLFVKHTKELLKVDEITTQNMLFVKSPTHVYSIPFDALQQLGLVPVKKREKMVHRDITVINGKLDSTFGNLPFEDGTKLKITFEVQEDGSN